MSMRSSAFPQTPSCELKGSGFTFTVLKVFDPTPERVVSDVRRRIEQAPGFFKGAPIIVDVQAVEQVAWTIAALVEALRALELIPIAIRGADPIHEQQARDLALGVLNETRSSAVDSQPKAVERNMPARLITEPVRSGQQVYAKSDLIVVGPVSHGAELLADGNIHVYGALRGRALAGLRGDRTARIFCRSLEAELISIAGYYRLADDLEPAQRGQPAQIHLDGENLHVQAL